MNRKYREKYIGMVILKGILQKYHGWGKEQKLTGIQKKNLVCHDLEKKTVFITFSKKYKKYL